MPLHPPPPTPPARTRRCRRLQYAALEARAQSLQDDLTAAYREKAGLAEQSLQATRQLAVVRDLNERQLKELAEAGEEARRMREQVGRCRDSVCVCGGGGGRGLGRERLTMGGQQVAQAPPIPMCSWRGLSVACLLAWPQIRDLRSQVEHLRGAQAVTAQEMEASGTPDAHWPFHTCSHPLHLPCPAWLITPPTHTHTRTYPTPSRTPRMHALCSVRRRGCTRRRARRHGRRS